MKIFDKKFRPSSGSNLRTAIDIDRDAAALSAVPRKLSGLSNLCLQIELHAYTTDAISNGKKL